LPDLIPSFHGSEIYLPVFGLNLVMAFINLGQIAGLREQRPQATPSKPTATQQTQEAAVHQRENRALALLTGVNMVNSLGIGLVAPLLPYWFHLKFGVGAGAIGSVYALSFFLTGISSLMVGKLSERVGLIRSIVVPRLIGVALLIGIPLMPAFSYAAVLYVARSIVNRGSVGARQAFGVGLVRDHRRGLASSLNAVSWSLPAAIGPAIGGWLIGLGSLSIPFALAAGLQLAYVILFPTVLGQYEPPRASASRGASP
jgi:MFS family permease